MTLEHGHDTFYFFFLFQTGSLYEVQAGLELTLYAQLFYFILRSLLLPLFLGPLPICGGIIL